MKKNRDRRSEALFKIKRCFQGLLKINEVCESEWQRLYGRLFQVEGPTCENLSPNAFEPERGILSRRVGDIHPIHVPRAQKHSYSNKV